MYQIGVDIGGTNIKMGLVDDRLQIVRRVSVPFPHEDSEAVAKRIASEVRGLLAAQEVPEAELSSVGVIVPGSIDPTGAIILDAYNLGFHNVPFKAQLQAQF